MDKLDRITVRRMVTPSLYLQGKGAIYYLGQKAFTFGDKAYVVGGSTALAVAGDRIKKSLASSGIEVVGWTDSVKDCTHATINRLADAGKHSKAHFVIGDGLRGVDRPSSSDADDEVPLAVFARIRQSIDRCMSAVLDRVRPANDLDAA